MTSGAVLTLGQADDFAIGVLLGRFGITLWRLPDEAAIHGSFWGEPEAGIIGSTVFARSDTPLHSVLHEASHVICMDEPRRKFLHGDAGGDDLEEAAVCYLQILLAEELDAIGGKRLMADMDRWGYSFRLGSTLRWFRDDATDAAAWLRREGLLGPGDELMYRCRR